MNKLRNDFLIFSLLLIFSTILSAQITLDSPVNGITGQPLVPSFKWYGEVGANYRLELSTSNLDDVDFNTHIFFTDYTIPYANPISVAYTEATINEEGGGYKFPLQQNKTYYWRIKKSGAAIYSPIWHFTTFPTTTVNLFSPTNGLTGVDNNVNFSWNSTINNATYKLQWIMSNSDPTPEQWLTANTLVTTGNQQTLPLGGGTKYYWRVAVVNSTVPNSYFYAFSSVFNFTTRGGAVVPVANYPDGVDETHPTILYRNDPTLNWYVDGSTNFLKYNIEIYNNATSALVFSQGNISAMSLYLGINLPPSIVYKWRVQSVYNDGVVNSTSAWSSFKYFTTQGSGTVFKPILSYPTGAVQVYTTTPTLNWFLNQGVSGLSFRGQYRADDNNFADLGNNVDFTTTQYAYQTANLVAGKTYYWRVLSFNSLGTESAWSDVGTFQVIGGLLTKVTQNYPKGDEIIYNTRPTFNWSLDGSGLGVLGFEIRLFIDNEDGTYGPVGTYDVVNPSAVNYTVPVDLLAGKSYLWQISVVTAGGTGIFSETTFRVYGSQFTGVPVLIWPIDATIYSDFTHLNWKINGSQSNILGYELVYSYSDVFAPSVTTTIPATALQNTTYQLSNLVQGAIYYWKVRSWYGASNYSNWSIVKSFLVFPNASPMQPIVGGPTNMALQNVTNPVLSWMIPLQSTSTLKYEVEVADNPDFNNATVTKNISVNSLTLNNPAQNKQYYWRVRSQVPAGDYSNYSNTGKFTLGSIPSDVNNELNKPEVFNLSQNYPNPFNPSTSINFQIANYSFVSLKVYDIIGREVKTLVNENKAPGNYNINFNASGLSSGVYYYELKAGEFRSIKKMILTK